MSFCGNEDYFLVNLNIVIDIKYLYCFNIKILDFFMYRYIYINKVVILYSL